MKFSGRWGDSVSQETEVSPSPIFLRLAENHRLRDIINKLALSKVNQQSAVSDTNNVDSERDGEEDLMRNWLLQLAKEMEVESFGKHFVCESDCIALLLRAFGVDSKPQPKVLSDPPAASISVFKRLFTRGNNTSRQQALQFGVIDRMLLRLGELQAEEPRRPARSRKYQLDTPKESQESTPTLSAAPDDATVADAQSTTPVTQSTNTSATRAAALANSNTSSTTASTTENKALWRPGYGTGEATSSTSRLEAERETTRLEKIKRTVSLLECLTVYVENLDETMDSSFWKDLLDCFDASCFLRVTMSSFFSITAKAVVENSSLYLSLLGLVAAIAKRPQLAPLIGEVPGVYKSLYELMRAMRELAREDLADEDDEGSRKLQQMIESTATLTDLAEIVRLESAQKAGTDVGGSEKMAAASTINAGNSATDAPQSTTNSPDLDMETVYHAYEEAMRVELFKDLDMRDPTTGKYSSHHFSSSIDDDAKESGGASKTRQRRLNRELKALRTTLPLHFGSSVALRIDRTRPFVGQFIIFAPQNTPYDSGAFLFDFFCTSDYPNEPPKVNLQTTGQGRVRFNPNLYQNGKVCLSLLGTWRGGASGTENWSAEHSSLYQVLVSIQSAILGSEFPYFNEPTVEALWGTEEGELQKRIHPNGGYERLRVATIQYAMTAQIRNPPTGFEDCVRLHFQHKKLYVTSICSKWIQEAESSNTVGHLQSLKEACDELYAALKDLGPCPQELLSQVTTSATSATHTTENKTSSSTADVSQEEAKISEPEQSQPAILTATPSLVGNENSKIEGLKVHPSIQTKMNEELAFVKDMYPNFPESVFKDLLLATAKTNADGEIIETDFLTAVEILTKMAS